MRADRAKGAGKASTRITLEGLQKQIVSGEVKELRLILKADVQGSVEALAQSLEQLSTDEVKLKVIHSSVGAINESDVMLASASGAIVLGFNVKAEPKATTQAQANGVDLRSYNVIYEAINDLKAALNSRAKLMPASLAVGAGLKGDAAGEEPEPVARDNQILSDGQTTRLLVAVRQVDDDLDYSGDLFRLVAVLNATGARFSQITRMKVRDAQLDKARLLVPSSRKGRGGG